MANLDVIIGPGMYLMLLAIAGLLILAAVVGGSGKHNEANILHLKPDNIVQVGEYAKEYYKQLSFYSCTVSNFEQYTLAKFIEEGYFEKHINRLRSHYFNKRNKIIDTIKNNRLNHCFSIMGEEAGVHFLLKIDTNKSEHSLMELAAAQGIKLSPLSSYYYDNKKNVENIYIMNYSSIPTDKIGEIIERLAKCCESDAKK